MCSSLKYWKKKLCNLISGERFPLEFFPSYFSLPIFLPFPLPSSLPFSSLLPFSLLTSFLLYFPFLPFMKRSGCQRLRSRWQAGKEAGHRGDHLRIPVLLMAKKAGHGEEATVCAAAKRWDSGQWVIRIWWCCQGPSEWRGGSPGSRRLRA